jgi:hypothetical protein
LIQKHADSIGNRKGYTVRHRDPGAIRFSPEAPPDIIRGVFRVPGSIAITLVIVAVFLIFLFPMLGFIPRAFPLPIGLL